MADSAYRGDEIEEKLAARGLKSRIHRRAYRNRKLSEAQKAANDRHRSREMQDRNDEPRLQHPTLHHSGTDSGGGQMNRRATLHRARERVD